MNTYPNTKLHRAICSPFYFITLLLLLITQNSFAATPADSTRAGENNLTVRQSTAAVEFEGKILLKMIPLIPVHFG